MPECLKEPPASPEPKKTRAATAWSTAGCSIRQPGSMSKSLEARFANPVVRVSILTGDVIRDRIKEYL